MVNNSDTKVSYQGNGQTTVFPFSFPFIRRDYIKVAIYDSLTDETKNIDSDYYVDTVANAVIYPGYEPGQEPAEALRPPILPETSTITIYRQTDVDQLTNLGEKYPLKDIENMADKLTEIIQEQAETLGRAVKVPVGDPKSPDEKLTDLQTYVKSAADSAKSAAESEANAKVSEDEAARYAAAANTYQIQAGAYAATAFGASAPAWDSTATYNYPQVVAYTDGKTYRCVGTNVTGSDVPGSSNKWVAITLDTDDFWEVDIDGGYMPSLSPTYSASWEIDGNGDLEPILAN